MPTLAVRIRRHEFGGVPTTKLLVLPPHGRATLVEDDPKLNVTVVGEVEILGGYRFNGVDGKGGKGSETAG